MNIVNLLGILFAVGVLVFAMMFGNENPAKLLDPHGALIVIGGTVACIGVAFKITRAFNMVLVFFRGMFTTRIPKNKDVILELMGFADAYRSSSPKLPEMIKNCKDPFMREAMGALVDAFTDEKDLIAILRERCNTMFERYNDEAKMFVSCGKFPPAMGLMGAVLGMIALLGSLGKPGAEKNIGPAMSVALVATLYGIAVANLFIIPIGENLSEVAKSVRLKNTIIIEGVRLIAKKVNAVLLAEKLNSFLLPSERVDRKKLKSAEKKAA